MKKKENYYTVKEAWLKEQKPCKLCANCRQRNLFPCDDVCRKYQILRNKKKGK